MAELETDKSGRVVIAATFTIEPLESALRFALDEANIPVEIEFSLYNQVFQELLSTTSLLALNDKGVDVVVVRIEDFIREIADIEQARSIVAQTEKDLKEALSQHVRRSKVPTVLVVLPPSPLCASELNKELHAATASLLAYAETLQGITLLSEADIDLVASGDRYDAISDKLAHVPFTNEHYASIALALTRKIHALLVPAHKVLVLDCDETLWRGVVGEDGVDHLTIPPALAAVQRLATQVQAKGILVALVSKNAERDVLEVFEKRPDMLLKLDHIVAHRINWLPKPANMLSLAKELNLGLDSFVFLDDNPVECALMRSECPQIVTLTIPSDENEVESFLAHLWTFDKVAVTAEDLQRTAMYKENAARQQFEESATDISAFIASLGVVVDIAPPEDAEWTRLSQLTQRTNQFNFTTRRRTEPEMRALSHDPETIVWRVKVRDRFGEYGIVGLVIANLQESAVVIDTFLLSCRVLGRGVEHKMLRQLGEFAKERGLSYLDVPFFQTAKNEPARAFADSVAACFRVQEANSVLYHISADAACEITHKPGEDPPEVIAARKSDEKKNASLGSVPASGAVLKERSKLYENFARRYISGPDILQALRAGTAGVRDLEDAPRQPETDLECKLLALWEEQLGIEGLGIDDDFFLLGGSSLLSVRLFDKITRQFGVQLPLSTILVAPTVRTLASQVEKLQSGHAGVMIELRPGTGRNFFIVHDGFGETLLYLNLARRMPKDMAILGIAPYRLPHVPLAHASIEQMADYYAKKIRSRQPRGPYFLGGLCAGGIIAFEVAAQLERAGEKVALVVVLDAATPQAEMRSGRIMKNRLGRLTQVLSSDSGQPRLSQAFTIAVKISAKILNTVRWEIASRAAKYWARARFRLLQTLLARHLPWPAFIPELTFPQIYKAAEALYTPKHNPETKILLVRARSGTGDDTCYREIYADEALGWKSLTDKLDLIDVDGGHSSMLQEPFVDSLADALLPYFNDKPQPVPKMHEETAAA